VTRPAAKIRIVVMKITIDETAAMIGSIDWST